MKTSISCIFFVFFACNTPTEKTAVQNSLIGKWQNITLNILLKRPSASDSLVVVKEGEWESIMGIKPIITEYKIDSSFSSNYYSLGGELIHTSVGKWWIRNDSLVAFTDYGEYVYAFDKIGDRLSFKSNLDWDQDGTPDLYEGDQLRVD